MDRARSEKLISDYLARCKDYQVRPCPDFLTAVRHGTPTWKLVRNSNFDDLALQPAADLLRESPELMGQFKSMDLSQARLGPSSATELSHLLSLPSCQVEDLNLRGQPLGADGARALAAAIPQASQLEELACAGCRFGACGARAFKDLFKKEGKKLRLKRCDLQNNFIPHESCLELEAAALGCPGLHLNLTGNRVYDEVLNAISHGAGAILAIVGAIFLGRAVSDKGSRHILATSLYSTSLIVLYLASTLYHSMYALGPLVTHIFKMCDQCAIFFLIAGSYGPFLLILFPGELWPQSLLCALWTAAILGIFTTALYNGPGRVYLQLMIYLSMGWSATSCLQSIKEKIGDDGIRLLVLGGILYSAGVPFFLKSSRSFGIPDHTIWHLFVLAGSAAHYFCILWYCVPH